MSVEITNVPPQQPQINPQSKCKLWTTRIVGVTFFSLSTAALIAMQILNQKTEETIYSLCKGSQCVVISDYTGYQGLFPVGSCLLTIAIAGAAICGYC